MKRFQLILVTLSLSLSVGAQSQPDRATRLVERFSQKIVGASALTYHFTHEGSGPLAPMFPHTEGIVKVVPSSDRPGMFDRARISGTTGAGDQAHEFDVVMDGDLVRSLDVPRNRVLSAPTWRNGVELVNFQYLLPVVLAPQLSSLDASQVRDMGEKTVAGMRCVAVEVDTPMATMTLYLGKEDSLLYGGVAKKPEAWGDGTITMMITDMKLVKSIPDRAFKLSVPDNFAEIEYSGSFPTLGEDAPDFTLNGFDGSKISLDSLEGRVVVLDFWATWCNPCKQAMPGLQSLHEEYASKGLTIIGVNHDERGDPHKFLAKYDFTYTFATADGSDIGKTYKPNLPTAVVIDRQGRMVEVLIGYFGEESDERLERIIRDLL